MEKLLLNWLVMPFVSASCFNLLFSFSNSATIFLSTAGSFMFLSKKLAPLLYVLPKLFPPIVPPPDANPKLYYLAVNDVPRLPALDELA